MSSLQVQHRAGFVSKQLSKDASAANTSSSRILYYGGASRSIPFLWEDCPGKPKRATETCSYSIDYEDEFKFKIKPFLTPPPCYVSCSGSKQSVKMGRRTRFLSTLVSKVGQKKSILSPTWSVASSKSSSSSLASSPRFTRKTKWFGERYAVFLCSKLDDDDDGDVTGQDKGASSLV